MTQLLLLWKLILVWVIRYDCRIILGAVGQQLRWLFEGEIIANIGTFICFVLRVWCTSLWLLMRLWILILMIMILEIVLAGSFRPVLGYCVY